MTDTTPVLLDHRYRFETGGCPIEAALDTLSGRWKGLLLFRIYGRATRFHELRKDLPHVSQRMLVRQLRELERDGLIRRSVTVGVLAKVEYSLTDAAHAVMPLLVGTRLGRAPRDGHVGGGDQRAIRTLPKCLPDSRWA